MENKTIVFITMSEFRKKANSLNMTEEQFVDVFFNKVENKNIIKGTPEGDISLDEIKDPDIIDEKKEILKLARQIFHPTNEELKNDLEYSKKLFSEYGIKDFQDHLSKVSPFKEFLGINS